MLNIPPAKILNKLPIAEMEQTLNEFISPLTELLPDKRLKKVVPLAVRGILTNETPVIAALAQSVLHQEADCWAAAMRLYRFMKNKHFNRRRSDPVRQSGPPELHPERCALLQQFFAPGQYRPRCWLGHKLQVRDKRDEENHLFHVTPPCLKQATSHHFLEKQYSTDSPMLADACVVHLPSFFAKGDSRGFAQ